MNIKTIQPEFGVNYDTGYVGFTYYAKDLVSRGIAYFERWDDLSKIPVSHTFIVVGNGMLVEAHLKGGVRLVSLDEYFNDPTVCVFFRKPAGWTPEIGSTIATAACSKIGCGYARALILEEAAANSFFGHWLNKWTKHWWHRFFSALLNRDTSFICSELVAYSLQQESTLNGKGILGNPADCIMPQELFEDKVIFEDWAEQAVKA